MNSLEAEMGHYTEWQEACAKFDTLDHLVIAFRFWRMLQHHKKHLASADAAAQKLEDCDRQKYELEVQFRGKQQPEMHELSSPDTHGRMLPCVRMVLVLHAGGTEAERGRY